MKIIVSESFYDEVQKFKNKRNPRINDTGYSLVFIGDKLVKKIAHNEYTEPEIEAFKIMSKYPKIFPKTKIIFSKGYGKSQLSLAKNTMIILQEKLDVERQKKFYKKITPYFNLEYALSKIVAIGFTKELEQKYRSGLRNMRKDKVSAEYITKYTEYVVLAIKLHKIVYANDILRMYRTDLNEKNFGLDKQGFLKIIDFATDEKRIFN